MVLKTGDTGLTRVLAAFKYSGKGLRAAWRHEAAFRQECTLALLMLPLALLLAQSLTQLALLIAVCVLVLVVELLNSAVEAVVDRIGPEHHDLAGRAKDMGSAAVLLSLLMALTTFVLVGVQGFLG